MLWNFVLNNNFVRWKSNLRSNHRNPFLTHWRFSVDFKITCYRIHKSFPPAPRKTNLYDNFILIQNILLVLASFLLVLRSLLTSHFSFRRDLHRGLPLPFRINSPNTISHCFIDQKWIVNYNQIEPGGGGGWMISEVKVNTAESGLRDVAAWMCEAASRPHDPSQLRSCLRG